jgi:hypothetical protein
LKVSLLERSAIVLRTCLLVGFGILVLNCTQFGFPFRNGTFA